MAYQPYGNIKIIMTDNNGSKLTENVGYTNANLISGNGDQVLQDANAINSFARGIANLTVQTYIDTNVEYSVSVNEVRES